MQGKVVNLRLQGASKQSRLPSCSLAAIALSSYAFPGLRLGQVAHNQIGISYRPEDILLPLYNIVHQRRKPALDHKLLTKQLADVEPFRQQISCSSTSPEVNISVLLQNLPASTHQKLLTSMCSDVRSTCSLLDLREAMVSLTLADRRTCSLYHADYVQIRFLSTLFGEGTQYIANADADRRLLGRLLGRDTKGYGVKSDGTVHQTAPGDALYLKGHAFEGNAGCGAVHRSGEASPDHKRLLFVLDGMRGFA